MYSENSVLGKNPVPQNSHLHQLRRRMYLFLIIHQERLKTILMMKVEEREDGKRERKRNVKNARSSILARTESKRNVRNDILAIQMTGRDTRKIRRGEDMIRIKYSLLSGFLIIQREMKLIFLI